MRILIVSYSDSIGGASRAIVRIHSALVAFAKELDVSSTLRVILSDGKTPNVVAGFPKVSRHDRIIRSLKIKLEGLKRGVFLRSGGSGLSSSAHVFTGLGVEIETSDADVVLLNWLGDQTISLEELRKVSKPIVLRHADMWFLLPLAHYPPDAVESSIRNSARELLNFVLFFWRENQRHQVKREFLESNVVGTISPSVWLRDASSSHESLKGLPHVHIPNTIDTDFWSPVPATEARKAMNIPEKVFSIGFGASGGLRDPRKGGSLLIAALKSLRARMPSATSQFRLDVFGQERPKDDRGLEFVNFHGQLSSDELRHFYSAVDVFVTLPAIEGFPNTVVEAASCARPSIATDIPGMRGIIDDGETGFLVNSGDVEGLSKKIYELYSNPRLLRDAGLRARGLAIERWSARSVASSYANFLRSVSGAGRL